MQIVNFFIENLFGLYTYRFEFSPEASPLTLITGPNGYGKTTILRIIANLNTANLYYFYVLRFDLVQLTFSDGSVLEIVQHSMQDDNETEEKLDSKFSRTKNVNFRWIRNGKTVASFVYDKKVINDALRRLRYSEWFVSHDTSRKIAMGHWPSALADKYLSENSAFNEIVANNQNQEAFLMMLQSIRTKFISANRIYKETQEREEELPIEKVVDKIKEELEKVRMRYVNASISDDALFIKEILSDTGTGISKEDYEKHSQMLQELADSFTKYIPIKIEIPSYKAENSAILSYYIKRLERKLANCNDVIEKIGLFDEMLQSKRFSNKNIRFSPQQGIIVETVAGEPVDIVKLSSGEQNEIVLLYKLIFEVSDKSILLVDEPENSLHVAWQKMIVADLTRIADIKKLQLIIATHSPVIVSYGKSFATDLYYLNKSMNDGKYGN